MATARVVASTRFEESGRVKGWWNTAFDLGQFLTPILIGVLVAATRGLPITVGIVGVATEVLAVLVGVASRRAPTDVESPAV